MEKPGETRFDQFLIGLSRGLLEATKGGNDHVLVRSLL
jgi:hypothetical protein